MAAKIKKWALGDRFKKKRKRKKKNLTS